MQCFKHLREWTWQLAKYLYPSTFTLFYFSPGLPLAQVQSFLEQDDFHRK